MTIDPRHHWRFAYALAGTALAVGGPFHPESDAKDSLRVELATMTSGDTWVLSHTLIAIGTALLTVGMWAAHRGCRWPESTRKALFVATVAMTAYVVETLFHLASVLDADALAAGEPAPIAFTHIGLAIVLYPLSGLTFAWLGIQLLRTRSALNRWFGIVGITTGVLHAASVPLTIIFPDAELTPAFAGAGMLFAVWSLGLGIAGIRPGIVAHGTVPAVTSNVGEAAYRQAENGLWHSLGARPSERKVSLPRLGVEVRVQEVGEGEPVLHVHGGPSAGTNWAPLAAATDGFCSILVDRPGTGLSDRLRVDAGNLEELADVFVVDLLDALELDRAHVVASSFGGFLALRAAAVAPERFGGMVQMACPAGVPGMEVPPFMRAAAITPLRRLITLLPPNERAARSMLRQIGHGVSLDDDRFTQAFMEWYLSLQRDTRTMANDLEMIATLVTATGRVHPALSLAPELLGRIEVPTHFYWGADDPFGGVEVAQRVVALMQHATLEIVPDAGHLPWLDDPARASRAVERFLRSSSIDAPVATSSTPAATDRLSVR